MTDKAVSDIDLKPTESMAKEAQRGLDWRKEFNRGGTNIGSSGGYGLLQVNGNATSGGGGGTLNGGMVKLDSPNTDQATEYLVKAKRVWAGAGGDTKFPSSNNYEKETITLIEIKG